MPDQPANQEQQAPRRPWHWGWAAALAAVTLATLAFRYALPIRDGDIWWHMLYGKYFLENKTLIADHTIFSWTPTTNDTIYCTWLPDIFFYLLHQAAGLPGLFAFRYACLLVLVLACYLYARKLKIADHPLTWLLCLLGVIMSYTAAFVKPEILSYVFMILLAWNWWHIRSSGEEAWKNCYLFPIIMLVWVNSHGGFVFGAVFLFLIGLGELMNTWLSPANVLSDRLRKHLLFALALAAVTPLLTPYGYHYPLQLFYDFLPTEENVSYNSKIAAYTSTFAYGNPYNLALTANAAILIILLLYVRNFKKIEWSTLLTNLFFAFLYTRFFRTTFYWIPILLFSSLTLLALRPLLPASNRIRKMCQNSFGFGTLVICGWLAWNTLYDAATSPEKNLWMGFGISDGNPTQEAKYIKKYFPVSRVGNTYDQGAYLLWELWPQNKVFFDSRHFPYRKQSEDFFTFSAGNNLDSFTKRYPCDLWCIGLQYSKLITGLLASNDWRLAFVGKNAVVLINKDINLPVDAPVISSDLFEPRNRSSAIDLLSFAINTGEWDLADKQMNIMVARFTGKPHNETIQWAKFNLHGLRAYYQGDYITASKNFELIHNPSTRIRFLLTNCYQFLTNEAWENNEMADALKFSQKSLDMVPDNPFSLYNLGLLNWWLQNASSMEGTGRNTITGEGGENNGQWRDYLKKFLTLSQNEKEFEEFRLTATAILTDRQTKQIRLLIPPPPINRKLINIDIKELIPNGDN